ncbi:hypothetical protein FGG08_001053 [Glutinoglossum americanum]|uniref:Ras guanine nucleotide exchange factor A n=1 Tax=Glutinoglossum americanum TaxID=1670608 RepID=A0A9P8I7S1_9PEZI|nr:hypothetical protein FGG08_001053 [Glutinoglossum americanum]
MSTGSPSGSRPKRTNSLSQKQPSEPSRSAESLFTAAPRPPFLQLRTHSSPLVPRTGEPGISESRASLDSTFSIRDDPFFRTYQSPQSVRLAKEVAQSTKTAPLRKGTSFFDSETPPPGDSSETIASFIKREGMNGDRKGMESGTRPQQIRNHSSASIPRSGDQLPHLDVLGGSGRVPIIRSPEKTPAQVTSDRSPHEKSWGNSEVETDILMREINIAVVGASGVGKSTFIQQVHDLQDPYGSLVSVRKMSIDGFVHPVRLVEVDISNIEIDDEQRIKWPNYVDGHPVQRVHGVLILYDVMNRDSIANIPELLNTFVKAGLSSLLVSCKCDTSPSKRQIDPNVLKKAGSTFGGVETFQTSASAPDSQKRSVFVVLRMILSRENGTGTQSLLSLLTLLLTITLPLDTAKPTPARRRANSSAHTGCPASPRPPSGQSKHSRASSELSGSLLRSFPRSPADTESYSEGSHARGYPRSSVARGALTQLPLQSTKSASTSPTERGETGEARDPGLSATDSPQAYTPDLAVVSDVPFKSTKSVSIGRLSQPSRDESFTKKIVDSFLDMDEENEDEYDSDDIPILDREDELLDKPARSVGQTWDELVDKLLAQPTSKSDSNFAAIFLCLYRMFKAPGELLEAFEKRFEKANNEDNHYLIKITSQLRYLSIMSQWLSEYPGDFSFPETRQKLSRFIGNLSRHRVFAAVIKDMQASLDVAVEDDDFLWGRSDFDREPAIVLDNFSNTSAFQSSSSTLNISSSTDEVSEDLGEMCLGEDNPSDQKRASESASISSSGGDSSGNTAGRAEQEALSLIPTKRIPFTKLIFNQFISTPDGDIAQELTRIDWIMFSSIRARDLVRHVSLSASRKEKCKSLGNVNRMIAHFNHVAYWVANMILLRDKAKHRARALEKFMRIAWELRHINNYNSLGAVIAGINGNAVHRLTQTRELVCIAAPQAQKNFMRLEILMGTQKSHFAYRLAWANSSSERIPFLPLHRRDLVSAQEGNRTFIGEGGDRINWKKFEIMGDVIVGIQKSQGMPFPEMKRNKETERMILEGSFSKDDDELYERSVQLEGPGMGTSDNTQRKKFPWFQR